MYGVILYYIVILVYMLAWTEFFVDLRLMDVLLLHY
jgi:hypothetical protein